MSAPYVVRLEPYRLDSGHIGEDVFRPVVISRHRTKAAARRALIRVITGTNPAAADYLRAPSRFPIALRYLVAEIAESGRLVRKWTANQLKES